MSPSHPPLNPRESRAIPRAPQADIQAQPPGEYTAEMPFDARQAAPSRTPRSRRGWLIALVGVAAIAPGWLPLAAWSPPSVRAALVAPEKTPANLQRAHAVASRGAAMFAAFAAKADEEGFQGVASLFRAAKRSQEVHVAALQAAMDELAVKASSAGAPEVPLTKDTKANIAAALAWIDAERRDHLAEAASAARAEGRKGAETPLNYTRQALTEIARFLRPLSTASLDDFRSGKVPYYVDRTCGFVVAKLDFKKCPVCYSKVDNFEKVE